MTHISIVKLTKELQHKADSFLRSEKDQESYLEFITDTHYTSYIALKDGKPVGIASMSVQLDTAELNFIYVTEACRRTGLAKRLFETIENESRSRKAEGLRVNCGDDNEPAKRFYEKMGMREVGRVLNYFSNNNVQVFFWKSL